MTGHAIAGQPGKLTEDVGLTVTGLDLVGQGIKPPMGVDGQLQELPGKSCLNMRIHIGGSCHSRRTGRLFCSRAITACKTLKDPADRLEHQAHFGEHHLSLGRTEDQTLPRIGGGVVEFNRQGATG